MVLTGKRILGLLVLAEMESKFILGRPHFFEQVVVSLPFKEFIDADRVAIIGSIVKRGPHAVILGVNVGPSAE